MKTNETSLAEALIGFALIAVMFLLAAWFENHQSLFF